MRRISATVLVAIVLWSGIARGDTAGNGVPFRYHAATPPAPSTLAVPWLVPPVDGPVARAFEAPGTEWGPGHRGLDLAVAPGTQVRAAAPGIVSFAGRVGSRIAVTIAHGGGLETTYSDLASTAVSPGDRVRSTTWIGTAGVAHDERVDAGGIHFGVKLGGSYVDPATYLGPLDRASAIHLAPLVWEPPPTLPAAFRGPLLAASTGAACDPKTEIAAVPTEPTRNLAVLIAGAGSKTKDGTSAALYEAGRDFLGYDPGDIYPFSYRGSRGRSLHQPYERADTFDDIRRSAHKLRIMLTKLARRHPGRAVDLIAHSQGGIVARAYLSLVAEVWDPALPRVEHLVTFASPHRGAPLAGAAAVLDATIPGRALLQAGSWWSRNRGGLPDPYAPSVAQLAPGSDLMAALAEETVLFGTRVLTVSIPHDVVVPADVSRWPGHPHSVVPVTGWNGHDAVVTSPTARGIAHAFLRGRPHPCRDAWDRWGPRIGGAVSALEEWLPRGYRAVETRSWGRR